MIINDKNKDSCSTIIQIIQNFTSHPATLPRGIIGYIEIPIIQTTPPHYRVQDVNSLIHSVIHTYHPDTIIPIRQNGYTDMNLCTRVIPQSSLEINKKEINDKTIQLPIPFITGNLRPSDEIRKYFPSLPYTTETQQFIKKFNFEYSDLTDTEYLNTIVTLNTKKILLHSKLELKTIVNFKRKDLLMYRFTIEID